MIGTSLLDQFNKVVFDVPRGHIIFEMNPVDQLSANRPAVPAIPLTAAREVGAILSISQAVRSPGWAACF